MEAFWKGSWDSPRAVEDEEQNSFKDNKHLCIANYITTSVNIYN